MEPLPRRPLPSTHVIQQNRQAYTLGVEEEYQLVDERGGELRSRARAVIASSWTGEMKPEMQQNTLEVGTRVCDSAAEVRAELERLRLEAAVAAGARGLRVVAAGLHPFSSWQGQTFTPTPTYQRIHEEYRRLAESQTIFGMHVHVGVPPGVDRARVMNVVRHYSAWLLALSASSPYSLGADTGYVSYRSILWRRWPRSGPPPRFGDEAEFGRLRDALVRTGCIDGPGRLYWELRPHHEYPTIEFRSPDVTPRLDDAVAIAALARALVMAAVEGELREPDLPESFVLPFLAENAWRASRYGVEAEIVDLSEGIPRAVPFGEAVHALLERLAPLVLHLGDGAEIGAIPLLLERGSAATRIRERYTEEEEMPELVSWLASETLLGLGLDRREEQRDA